MVEVTVVAQVRVVVAGLVAERLVTCSTNVASENDAAKIEFVLEINAAVTEVIIARTAYVAVVPVSVVAGTVTVPDMVITMPLMHALPFVALKGE